MSTYTYQSGDVTLLSNAVPGYDVPGATIPGMPPQGQTTGPNGPETGAPGPAWRNAFGHLTKLAVLYDVSGTQLFGVTVVIGQATLPVPSLALQNGLATDPDIAMPGPAWQNQFGHLSKNVILFDVSTTQIISFLAIAGQAILPAPVIFTGLNPVFDPDAALPGSAWRNQFAGAKRKLIVLYDSQPILFSPYCFTGSTEVVLLSGLGGTELLVSIDATSGGTATDFNAGMGGTAVDGHAGLGGSETNDPYGGTATDPNDSGLGGFLFGGCYD